MLYSYNNHRHLYSFPTRRSSDLIQNMDNYSEGQLPFTIIDQVSYDEEKISSTKIREMIRSGNIKRSEEHTSELQSRGHHVCRLLLEQKREGTCREKLFL